MKNNIDKNVAERKGTRIRRLRTFIAVNLGLPIKGRF